ncbi:MAG: D-alanyl-D-alanine carboxypeptidase, partial [Glaciimonas sp.]|nr:D-alanyl-D-alanine carboxypeptidase [Glaciimonas sp.]
KINKHNFIINIQKGLAEKLKPVFESTDPLLAPLNQNAKVGTLKINVDGKTITALPVVALEAVNQASFFGRIWDSIRLFFKKS